MISDYLCLKNVMSAFQFLKSGSNFYVRVAKPWVCKIFFAGGRLFGDSKQMYVKYTACKPHPSKGSEARPLEDSPCVKSWLEYIGCWLKSHHFFPFS